MGEVGIYDREGSILRKGDYRRLIGAVGRREGARTGKDGQAEAVSAHADGYIVGSALVKRLGTEGELKGELLP